MGFSQKSFFFAIYILGGQYKYLRGRPTRKYLSLVVLIFRWCCEKMMSLFPSYCEKYISFVAAGLKVIEFPLSTLSDAFLEGCVPGIISLALFSQFLWVFFALKAILLFCLVVVFDVLERVHTIYRCVYMLLKYQFYTTRYL